MKDALEFCVQITTYFNPNYTHAGIRLRVQDLGANATPPIASAERQRALTGK